MQDNLPYLIAKLEQNEAEAEDMKSIRVILQLRLNSGMITPELYDTLVQYVDQLEERNNDE
jgi:hypothetical protein